jgi:hypothetical protein
MTIPHFEAMLARLSEQHAVLGFSGTWREAAVHQGLLPVYSDWECCYALTSDADVVYSADVQWPDPMRLTNERHRFVVLAQATDRYSELAYLRPVRRPNDPTCTSCGGTGQVDVPKGSEGKFICECGGLGWYPAGSGLGAV